jgi:hypothetical protein
LATMLNVAKGLRWDSLSKEGIHYN